MGWLKQNPARLIVPALVLTTIQLLPRSAHGSIPVVGGPTYDTINGNGYFTAALSAEPMQVTDSGVALGLVQKSLWPSTLGFRTVRWSAPGNLPIEFPGLGTDPIGSTEIQMGAAGLDKSGVLVGGVDKYDSSGNFLGLVPVRWDVSSNSIVEMAHATGSTADTPAAINSGGVSVGGRSRWDATGTSVTTLQALPTDTTGMNTWATGINDAGTAVGYGHDFSVNFFDNERAVRWDPAGNVTQLGVLGYAADGHTEARPLGIAGDGTAVGFCLKYDAQHTELGSVAVRWPANGTAAIELAGLGVDVNGQAFTGASAMNVAGTVAGNAGKFDASGNYLGARTVRWDPNSINPTELGSLTASDNSLAAGTPLDISDNGLIVGIVRLSFNNDDSDYHAVFWDAAGNVMDLNSLIDASSGWTLISAQAVSDTGWVTGVGIYDGDGPGGEFPYARLYLLQVPEPASLLSAVACAAIVLNHRRSRRR